MILPSFAFLSFFPSFLFIVLTHSLPPPPPTLQAFDTPEDPYLPKSVLWRQKEQFSDGVGYGWIDALRDAAAEGVSRRGAIVQGVTARGIWESCCL